jgi:hypothetical protein
MVERDFMGYLSPARGAVGAVVGLSLSLSLT